MSKQIKQLEMDSLKKTFQDVRDLVVLSSNKLSCQEDNQLRAALRNKSIRIQVVKNSLARRVFDELGMKVSGYWEGTTALAWGAGSLAELSNDLDSLLKKTDKLKVKGAISDGRELTFKAALAMPTRSQALGRISSLVLSPASRLLSQILGPAARIAGQIKTLSEKASGEIATPGQEAG
jgi:large subunit ribosomal protein L10